MSEMTSSADASSGDTSQFVTLTVEGQLFGIPVLSVQDVLAKQTIANVPLAHPVVAGLINLRGRIVTVIDLRRKLGLPPSENAENSLAVGVELNGESYGLVIDSVGDVLVLDDSTLEANPANLDPRWSSISNGVHRLDGRLMVILDVERVLDLDQDSMAA